MTTLTELDWPAGPNRRAAARTVGRFASLAVLVALAVVAPAQAAPGNLDPSFSGDGIVLTGWGGEPDGGSAMALQADGKIVVAGTTTRYDGPGGYDPQFALARLHPDGSLDLSFDGDGKQVTHFGAGTVCMASAVAIQPDGKIVVAGSVRVSPADWNFALARYHADGSLDSSFADDGTLTTGRGGYADSVAVQADGKILVAGAAGLARYKADGSIDSSFAGDGMATGLLGSAHSLAIQGDDRIVVAGTSGLARYHPDGSLDTTFSGDGTVSTDSVWARSAAIQADGRIVVAGAIFVDHGEFDDYDFALLRYTPDGALDTTFGSGGMQITTFNAGWWQDEMAAAVALQPDGKIVAAGTSTPVDWVWEGSVIVLARYATNGAPDPSFGDGGEQITGYGVDNSAAAVAIQDDGRIVLAGSGSDPGAGSNHALVARYEGDPPAANAAPAAALAFSCSGLVCLFDAGGSSDPDGAIAGYRWDFGDGTSASGSYVRKEFAQYGTYSARLTVTDDAGATGAREETLALLRLTARGSMVRGAPRIELSWNGSAGTSYWVYRGSKRVGVVTANAFSDRPPVSASRTYSYTVCEASGPYCTATETVRL
jgi:uncharacterized delta-60 repeat protein